MEKFSESVIKQLKHYVYGLRDPADPPNNYFYIGKGENNRVFDHLNEDPGDDPSSKLQKIQEIKIKGRKPTFDIIRGGIGNERIAFAIEAALIDALGGVDGLTNKVRGHGAGKDYADIGWGLMKEPEVREKFQGQPFNPTPDERFIGFKVNQRWRPHQVEDELYENTKNRWRIGKRREAADYALAVSFGIIREVYKINKAFGENGWESFQVNREGRPLKVKRWGFQGWPEPLMQHYINTTVDHYKQATGQNPAFYINC
jgi:hypothetical protein